MDHDENTRLIDIDGIRTRVFESGAGGETMLLIHGGLYGDLYSLDCWSQNLTAFADRYHTVAYDKPGQGYSDFRGEPADYTFDRVVAHGLAVLDRLVGQPAYIVGHSMGALLAAEIAVARPERVASLVLVDSNTIAPDDPRFPRGKFYRDLEDKTPPGPPTRSSVRMEPDQQSYRTGHVTDEFVERLLEIARRPQRAAAHAALQTLRAQRWEPSMEASRSRIRSLLEDRGLPCRTLVVWGGQDPSAPMPLAWSLFDRVRARTPGAQLHIIADAGHYVFREEPDAFADAVLSFCARRAE